MRTGTAWMTAVVVAGGLCLPALGAAQEPPERAGLPVRTSWTSDRVAVREGDIVTILVDELTLAEADRDESTTRDRDRNVGVSLGAAGATGGGSLRSENDVARSNRGRSARRERFAAELSARIVELTPMGAARVEGVKRVTIDDHEQEVVVRGWIRTQDLGMDNTIPSWRVADAEILYESNGKLTEAGGLWSKLLDLILP